MMPTACYACLPAAESPILANPLPCPAGLLAHPPLLQVSCCFAQSVASTRWAIQDEMHLQNT